MNRSLRVGLASAFVLVASACVAEESTPPSPSVSTSATSESSPSPSVSPTVSSAPSPTTAASPTPEPEPALSLDAPEGTDARVVTATVTSEIGAEGGTLTVIVTSAATERIDELVLRWPTELNEALFIAPFTPSPERIVDGGSPLVQPWTKWVVGPGEKDEPDGTISVGWGPLLPGATLTIGLNVTRQAAGPVEFDFQVLAGNDLLTLDDGEPAELRIEVP
ncbi:MAG: hypothetical protein ACR2GO_03710 [Candidatus Limnocylindria bacterium]